MTSRMEHSNSVGMSMSVTTDRPSASGDLQSTDQLRTLRWHLAAMLLGALVILASTSGWFSADEVVMRQQSQLLIDGSWTVEPDPVAAQLDPDRSFALLARSNRINGEVAPYTKHPLAPLVFATGLSVGGGLGLYLPGLVSLMGAAVLFSRRFQWSPLALWIPVVATTSLFHLTVVWAHLPALAVATAACLLAFPDSEQQTLRRVVLASVAVGTVALLRSEGLLLAAAISIGLVVAAKPDLRSRLQSALPLLSGAAIYLIEPLVRDAMFGSSGGPLDAPVANSAAQSFVLGRLEVLQIMLIEPSTDGGLGRARLIGLLLLLGGSVALRLGRLRKPSAQIIFGVAAVMYSVGVFGSPIPGLLVAMPVMAAVIPWISLRDRVDRGVAAAAIAFTGAVILTSYDNAGGGDWGARYLFVGVPLLVLLVIPAVERVRRSPAAAPLLIGALICGLAVQVGILEDVTSRGSIVETVDSVRETVETEMLDDPSLVVAVSDERLARFLYDRGLRGPSFHVPPDAETAFDQLMSPKRILWVDLKDQSEFRVGPTVATAGSVVMRTEVRR